MRPLTGGKRELFRRLAAMPFLDRMEMAALSGWSQSAVYEAARRLEDDGLIASVPHGDGARCPTRRFHLTADGLRRLAQQEDLTLDRLLRSYPLAARWRRVLLERLDAVAVVYRLASAVANIHHPIRFRWYRAMSMDAAIILPDGRTIGIVRQGHVTDRTGFSQADLAAQGRAAARRNPARPPRRDPAALRPRGSAPGIHANGPSTGAGGGGSGPPTTRCGGCPRSTPPSASETPSTGSNAGARSPAERPLARVSMPQDIDERGSERGVPEHMLPALLKPTEKRVLDLLSDWPWLALGDLAGLLGVTNQRASQLTTALEGFGLAARVPSAERRLVLTDAGLTLLARRDRAAVGGAKKRWSAAPPDAGAAAGWRSVSGRRSRQLLRDMQHTASVHGFVAALSRQARVLGWDDRPARPAPQGVPLLPLLRREALGAPRRLRDAQAREDRMALLPGVGAEGGAAGHHGGATRPIPALLLVPPAHRRPRRSARRPGRLRRRHRPDPLPESGAGRDGPSQDRRPPAGLPPRAGGAGGAAGTGMVRPGRRLRAGAPPDRHARRTKAMRIYYIDESEGPRYYVRSALGVNAERWNGLHGRIQDWRTALAGDYSVPTSRELHACDLLAGRGKLARIDNTGRRLTPVQGAEIFMDGLRIIENAAHSLGGIEVVNVCLRKADVKGYEQVSLDRLLNRINTSVAADGRYAHLIFDEGGERMVRRLYGRLRSRNPVPSKYEAWEDGAPTKDIPIERIIGGPSFRSSQDDDLLQMADLIAHALLKQEEEPSQRVTELGIRLAFGILDRALNRRASRTDPQGVVRR